MGRACGGSASDGHNHFHGEPIMLYLGIDLHTRQLTVCLRDEVGNVLQRRQVGTHPEKLQPWFDELQAAANGQGGFVAILEVCGFCDWLVARLKERGCREIVVIQPDRAARKKTDRRDAARLSELLWINRLHLLEGRPAPGLRRVELPTEIDGENRQLTALRQRLGVQRTRTINRLKRLLHKHNLIHEQPTKTFVTKAVLAWLKKLPLPYADRLETDLLLEQLANTEAQLAKVYVEIEVRAERDPACRLVRTIRGCGAFTALAITSRIGRIERFARGRSLANFFGLTPTCSSSGESGERLGHISREGSSIVRFLLGQLVTRALRVDPGLRRWYQGVRRRRGAKIAVVGVMRKLATSIHAMLKNRESYELLGVRKVRDRKQRGVVKPGASTS